MRIRTFTPLLLGLASGAILAAPAYACATGDVSVSFSSVPTPSPTWNPLSGSSVATARSQWSVTPRMDAERTVDEPSANKLPEAGEHVTLGAGSAESVATGRA